MTYLASNSPPRGQIYGQHSNFWQFGGVIIPHFGTKSQNWLWEQNYGAKFHIFVWNIVVGVALRRVTPHTSAAKILLFSLSVLVAHALDTAHCWEQDRRHLWYVVRTILWRVCWDFCLQSTAIDLTMWIMRLDFDLGHVHARWTVRSK